MKQTRRPLLLAPLTVSLVCASTAALSDDAAPTRFLTKATAAQEVRGSGTEDAPFVAVDFDSSSEAAALFKFDRGLSQMRVRITPRHLEGNLTRAHLHCARAGENGPIALGFIAPGPLSQNGKQITGTLNNADLQANQNLDPQATSCRDTIGRPINTMAALAYAMRDGLVYLNIHTDLRPAGEVRGQVYEDDVDAD